MREVMVPCQLRFHTWREGYQKRLGLTSTNLLLERMVPAMGTKVRSAVTGRYVKKSEATKHPKTTVAEKTKK